MHLINNKKGVIQTVQFLFISLILLSLIKIAWTDYKRKVIPDRWVLFLAVVSVLLLIFRGDIVWTEHILGTFCVSVPLLICAVVFPGSFGGGDIKLMSAGGLLLGWRCALLAFIVSVYSAGIYIIIMFAGRRLDRKTQIAFGPALCVGIVAAMFWGKNIFMWYQNLTV